MDLALESAGGSIVLATSYDEKHPPENMIDDDETSYWSSTGMYPQEFVVALAGVAEVQNIKTVTTNVKTLTVERSDSGEPDSFETVFTVELADREGDMVMETHQLNRMPAKYLKFVIENGYESFCTVHGVQVHGDM